jgi:hypothetical protein
MKKKLIQEYWQSTTKNTFCIRTDDAIDQQANWTKKSTSPSASGSEDLANSNKK